MIWAIIIIAVIIVVMYKTGVFELAITALKKPVACQHCGNMVKGYNQVILGEGKAVLCKNCGGKIPSNILYYAKSNWSYEDYTDFVAWDNETKEERDKFKPDYEYGARLSVDTEHKLFRLGYTGAVFRFNDIKGYNFNFEVVDQLRSNVIGKEYIIVSLSRPNVNMKYEISMVELKLKNNDYELSDGFKNIIEIFEGCVTASQMKDITKELIEEYHDYLSMYGYENEDDMTKEELTHRRDELIKSINPTGNKDSNEAYLQKINDAYELLCLRAPK